MPKYSIADFLIAAAALLFVSSALAQPADRSVVGLFNEVDRYEHEQRNAFARAGKRYDAAARDNTLNDRKSLAKKYAAEIETRGGLKEKDYYFLGRLHSIAGNEKKTLESMKTFIAQYPADTAGDMIKSALGNIIVLSSKIRQMDAAEDAFARWIKTEPKLTSQQPALQDHLATGHLKVGDYEQAITHAQTAFDLLKTLSAKTPAEKRNREQIYMNLVEVLALGYKRNKNSDQALNILAEARAESFAIPSANLYRKVMDFVEGSGFSEKKLMQKVESYASADPAPEMNIVEWLGQDPIALEDLRGKVVLLDFWATWCMPCIATFPRLKSWHKKYSGSDFLLVGVTQYYGQQDGKRMSGLQELEYLKDFKQKHKLPYPFAIAGPTEALMKYGINAYPTTVLLDRNGVVRYIGIGAGAEESANLGDMIEKVLKENNTRVAASTR